MDQPHATAMDSRVGSGLRIRSTLMGEQIRRTLKRRSFLKGAAAFSAGEARIYGNIILKKGVIA